MFKSEKVHDVLVCAVDGFFWVKATVEASFSLSKTYLAAATLSDDGSVARAACECRAGRCGVCKHAAAMLWFILDTVRCGSSYIKDTTSCTEKPKAWGTGSKHLKVNTFTFSKLSFVKHEQGKMKRSKKNDKSQEPVVKVTEQDLQALHGMFTDRAINPMLAAVLQTSDFQPVPWKEIQCEP